MVDRGDWGQGDDRRLLRALYRRYLGGVGGGVAGTEGWPQGVLGTPRQGVPLGIRQAHSVLSVRAAAPLLQRRCARV